MSLLTVTDLTKTFGAHKAVDHVSFSINEGRCIALLGPNGAGKTTILQMLSGLMKPTSGTIMLEKGEKEDIRQWIGYLPQYPSFYTWMTAEEFLLYVGRLFGMEDKSLRERISVVLELVELDTARKRKISGFSGGMKQRLGLAQALIHEPRLLLLDEPVSALDPIGRRNVLQMMNKLKEKTTIFFSTHVLHDAEEISDDIIIMKAGKIIVDGELADVKHRHQSSVLLVETKEPLEKWMPEFPFIKSITYQTPYSALISITQIEDAKRAVLEAVLAAGVSLNKFEVLQDSLEDLFLRAVEK